MQAILHNHDVMAALVFCLAAAAGQFFHAVKKWGEGTAPGPVSWMIGNPKRAVAAVIGNGAGMLIFIQTGVLGPLASLPDGWWAVTLFGFMNGYSFDSGLNRATKKENTEQP